MRETRVPSFCFLPIPFRNVYDIWCFIVNSMAFFCTPVISRIIIKRTNICNFGKIYVILRIYLKPTFLLRREGIQNNIESLYASNKALILMGEDTTNPQNSKVVVNIDYLPKVNYAMLNNGVKTLTSLIIHNQNSQDWNQLKISVFGNCIKENSALIENVRAGQSVQVKDLEVEPDIQVLANTTEAVRTSFTLRLENQDALLFQQDYPIEFMAYDEWAGGAVMPEYIAAFVVPNNPLLSRVKLLAAQYLEKWTGESAFTEYQTQNRNKVRLQVAALYEALRSEGIIYSSVPASFETQGQRVRLADKVLTDKTGNCLDISLLFASCLEDVGIYPVIIFMKGLAMVGAWLTPIVMPGMVSDDVSYLLKETADGNDNIVLVETTSITNSGKVSFDDAVSMANLKLRDEDQFHYFVDVHRCRLGNIRPLPQRVMKDGAWVIDNEGIEHPEATQTVEHRNHYELSLESSGQPLTKQQIWERKLLDFTLRNNLLNAKVGKRVLPFISFEVERLEDRLQQNVDYQVTPSPGPKIDANADKMYDSRMQASEYQQIVSELMSSNKIASYLTEAELQDAMKYFYRTARTALEENGANSLFLALGMLKWFETPVSEQPRFAPILLLPVDIIRKSGNKYVIRKRDEDIMLNITLVEFLKQNYNINLDVLKELPMDKSGVDVQLIFTYFRRAVLEQKKWNVLEEFLLGLFSFNKFVMWNDIHSNADKLKENQVVASLMENHDKQENPPEPVDAGKVDRESKPMDFAIPLDVDSSQMEAIVESGRGQTFILHGPPGTGKSQTITNMIANALYQGRRVLFVAEKMAALSVVQSRLQKIGLAPFCLELHSNKVTKKHFLQQMEEVLNVTKIREPEEYARKSEELFAERKELISYMEALHSKLPSGFSLYECISEYLMIPQQEITDGLPACEQVTKNLIDNCRAMVEQADAVLAIVGQPDRHVLFGLEPSDNRMETLDGLQQQISALREQNEQLKGMVETLNNTASFALSHETDLTWLRLFADYLKAEQQVEEQHDQLTASYNEDVVRLDVAANRKEWSDIRSKWFLPRYFAKKKYLKSLQRYGQVLENSLDSLFQKVEDYQNGNRQLKEQAASLALFADEHCILHDERLDAYRRYAGSQPQARRQAFLRHADDIEALNQQMDKVLERVNAMMAVRYNRSDIMTCADRWLSGYGQVRDWYHWVELKQRMKQLGLHPAVRRIEQGEKTVNAIQAYLKGVFHMLIRYAIDQNEQLRMFNGLKFRQQIEKYKEDTMRFQELSKAELYSKLAARIPSASIASVDGSEISILKRNIANGGRGTSIRSIIDSIPTLLPRLCPCMLMSPISVAQFLDLNNEKFDIVIFDEASQMPTSEAVGAIARGKSLIVVGDSKQMPPTSFFQTTQVNEEEADIDDMESILDDCITLSLCEHQLKWHYRSKHESLIAFSNSQYYGNALFTFPSVDDRQAKVSLVPVQGVYDKGHSRSNAAEAKAIVDEILRRLQDQELSQFSIGVVAFSKVQGDRIEDELTDALDLRPDLKEKAYNVNEPIFIKNLENVQGDERDVILFSVGYGADKTGKVSMNFGPLNNPGGERRLNVAVSRARYEMIVFSTMKSSQIDLKRSKAKGVEGLKRFLEFAETGILPFVSDTMQGKQENVVVEQICLALQEHGYITDAFVGKSNFKIDIAVSTKDHPDEYILGILCDGRNYYETKTTRDREIVQPNVLKMLNWRVMRVYSIDWYENRERALQQILDELKIAEQEEEDDNENPLKQQANTPQPEPDYFMFDAQHIQQSDASLPEQRDQKMKPYEEANVSYVQSDKSQFRPDDPMCRQVIREIVRIEQPITEAYLGKRLAKCLGYSYASVNVMKAIELATRSLYRETSPVDGEPCFWLEKKYADAYSFYRSGSARSISEIPAIEVINAVKEVIREEFSLPKNRIPSVVAKKLGFGNLGPKINETVNTVLNWMEQCAIININGEMVSMG